MTKVNTHTHTQRQRKAHKCPLICSSCFGLCFLLPDSDAHQRDGSKGQLIYFLYWMMILILVKLYQRTRKGREFKCSLCRSKILSDVTWKRSVPILLTTASMGIIVGLLVLCFANNYINPCLFLPDLDESGCHLWRHRLHYDKHQQQIFGGGLQTWQ